MSATVLGNQDQINEWRLREFHRMLGLGSEELDPSQSVYFVILSRKWDPALWIAREAAEL